ncbi:MAG: winged helix-turn-helix domain-containing protein [Verrucomicrobiota bacterium]
MILIVSPDSRESAALTTLCEAHDWTVDAVGSLKALRRLLRRLRPKVILCRQKLGDGYSDDIFALIADTPAISVKTIVLATASTTSAQEARQLALGADCVLRDPVRPEVLLGYLTKYCSEPLRHPSRQRARASRLQLAGAVLDPSDRRLQFGECIVQLTPREVSLVRVLIESRGQVVSYEDLYEEVLGRKFRGDTSNMRVLLGKLCFSASFVGLPLRQWIEVIPKMGYRYSAPRLLSLQKPTSSEADA